jgi:hypothetical protein
VDEFEASTYARVKLVFVNTKNVGAAVLARPSFATQTIDEAKQLWDTAPAWQLTETEVHLTDNDLKALQALVEYQKKPRS